MYNHALSLIRFDIGVCVNPENMPAPMKLQPY